MTQSAKFPANDPQDLLRRIREAFPALNWRTYQYINKGWDHEVIILDGRIVFRFPNEPQYVGSLKHELAVLKQIKPLVAIAIPDYIYAAADGSFAGYPLIAGQPLHKKLFDSLTLPDRTALAQQLAGFLSTIHRLPKNLPALRLVPVSDMKDFQQRMERQVTCYLRPILSKADFIITQEILAKTAALLTQTLPSAFLHGDVYNNNLLWNDQAKQLGLIDFSDMNIGDPAFDFAELYEYGRDFVRQVYDNYAEPKDDTFLARAWTYQQWVGVFMMTNHFVYRKTSFAKARETFDWVKTVKL